jgi:hypothetical protein
MRPATHPILLPHTTNPPMLPATPLLRAVAQVMKTVHITDNCLSELGAWCGKKLRQKQTSDDNMLSRSEPPSIHCVDKSQWPVTT